MPKGDEPSQREIACIRFIENCAVPICGMHGEEAKLFGTGSLFRAGEVVCLVTAKHVLDDLDVQVGSRQIVVPVPGSGLVGPRRREEGIGEFRDKWFPTVRLLPRQSVVVRSESPCEDLGCLVLDSSDVLKQLGQAFHFLDVSELLAGDPPAEPYYVAGYPLGASLRVEGGSSLRFFYFRTERLANAPGAHDWKEPPDPNVNFFLKPPQRILNQRDEPIGKPDLRGMSGCLVWVDAPAAPPGAIWLPQQQMRIAGIQTSCIHSEVATSAIRATNAAAIGRLLAALPSLAAKNRA